MPDKTIYRITAICLIVINLWVFFVMLFYSYKFFQIYRFQHKWITMFLFMLNIWMLLRTGNFIQEYVGRLKDWTDYLDKWIDDSFTFLSIFSFVAAAVFNIFNWHYQILDISLLLSDGNNYKKTLDVILTVILSILGFILLSLLTCSWAIRSLDADLIVVIYSYVFSSLNIVFAVVFSVTSAVY